LRCGILYGAVPAEDGWLLHTGQREVAEFALTVLQEKKRDTAVLEEYERLGNREYAVRGHSADFDALLDALSQGRSLSASAVTCPSCETQLLRGIFLSCGHLTAPSSGYHLELAFPSEDAYEVRVQALAELLTFRGCPPKTVLRASARGLYYKNSGIIEDLLIQIGAPRAAFGVMNAKIEREIRNQENRATNCVTTNIRKTVSAARRQVNAVEALEAAGRLSGLSDELQETAQLRREYPDATLAELAELHVPPITKSGLNHRLARLLAAAEEFSSDTV
jgi:DNA-binding protein WhiA